MTMMYSVVDIAGVNRVSARIMTNAAAAVAGMALAAVPALEAKPLVAATMFGVTTPCVTRARERLEELGYEVLVFHATGAGGQSMEALAAGGFLAGVLDVDDHRAGRRARRRRALGRPRPARGGGRGRPAAGRLARRSRHGQLRPARDGAAAVRGAEPVRPQRDRHADAHDARGVRRARPPDRPQAVGGDRPDRAVHPARRHLDDRRAGPAVLRSRRRRGAASRACARRSTRRSRCTSGARRSTIPPSPRRWPTGCTS